MIKKLANVVVLVLALNFLAVAGGVGALVATKKLDKEKVHAIRDLIVGQPETPQTQPAAAEPAAQELPPDSPLLRLDAMLAKAAGRTPSEQMAVATATHDERMILLERRFRELENQRIQIQQAREELENQRKNLLAMQEELKRQTEEQAKLAEDKGFQDTLALYQALPPKRTKEIFKTLSDETVVRYLQSMEPRQAGSILKEFKTPDETIRAQGILEKMRQAGDDKAS